MNDYFPLVKKVLDDISFGTLATATPDGQPWNSPVVMVHDSELNLYWFSDRDSQHGRNVQANPRVFVVFYDSTVPANILKLDRGFYVEATAREINDPEIIEHALSLRPDPRRYVVADFAAPNPRRVYQATPSRVWINDIEKRNGKFYRDCRLELPLNELKQFLAAKTG